jgi:hypothetical protein
VRTVPVPRPELTLEELAGTEHSMSWQVPEKILWRDFASPSSVGVVNEIIISADDDVICGISFNYTSGYSRCIGSMSNKISSFCIGEGNGLVQVAMGYSGGVVSSLEVSRLGFIYMCHA